MLLTMSDAGRRGTAQRSREVSIKIDLLHIYTGHRLSLKVATTLEQNVRVQSPGQCIFPPPTYVLLIVYF